VRTLRLEGAAFAELGAPLPLGRLRIEECSGPATVALVAVDDRPLAESRRLVLVFATDARNSGMTFADDGERQIVKPGGLPVLVRTAKVRLRFFSLEAAGLRLWPLSLNGTRRAAVALRVEDGAVELILDTAVLPDGPATFYELASEHG
jgi:hypothetical protein